ncbi:transcription elongation factor A N-terminal and central domain-containing protein [Anguilla anguilla]|uniref:transcription elongation factor A N-terminal and central domain-containing protein n=1 Tax=Anguilla anguilla TaxID=7936 RepID=UPI0015ACB047|nr:transcription elongation factor A N-terminal and central domain-containing protein [Anguilla anguilla]XP_035249951.1 transcription elongation factor A N-terminal and central domain-containing protein [Anguilla anguilla]
MNANQISHHARQIEKLHCEGDYDAVRSLLRDLERAPVTLELLRETGVAKVLHQVLRTCPVATARKAAKLLLSGWRKRCGGGAPVSTGSRCHRRGEAEDRARGRGGSGERRGGDGSRSPGSSDEEEEEDRERKRLLTEEGSGVSEVTREAARSVEDSAVGASASDRGGDVTVTSSVTSPVEFTQGPAETAQIATTPSSSPNSDASPLRSKSTQLLLQALGPEGAGGDGPAPDLSALARDIEEHVFLLHGRNEPKYRSCVRSKVSNLRNRGSPHLREGLLQGTLGPEAFARMSAAEMAGRELQELRREYTKSAIREHQRPLGVEGTATDKVRCRRCDGFDCRVTQISRGALFLPGWVRSGNPDEDTMTFMTCAGCGEQWYHSGWVCL